MDIDDFKKMGFTGAEAALLDKYKHKISKVKRPQNYPDSEEQKLRLFLEPAFQNETQIKYVVGKVIRSETGSMGILDRVIEFKAIQCSQLNTMKDAFEKKVGEFVIGCMNARQNGTMILGVLDGKHKNLHGQIAGILLPRCDWHFIGEWMDELFFSKSPKLFFNASASTLQAIR
jgi:hypothetical protein